VLSGVIELAQGVFTTRTADAWDAVAGILGAAAVWSAWRLAWRLTARTG
jgi:hypothetical protein